MIINRYIMPVGIIVYLLISLCVVTGIHAAQQPVTTIASGTGTTGLNLKQYNDTYINPRLTNIAANDTDLYTNKADKSSFSSSSAFAVASSRIFCSELFIISFFIRYYLRLSPFHAKFE